MWNRFKRAMRSFVGFFVTSIEDPELILEQNIRDMNDQVPRMNESIAMRCWTSVSSETWRCAPDANTAIIASTMTAIGAKRRRRAPAVPASFALAEDRCRLVIFGFGRFFLLQATAIHESPLTIRPLTAI